MSSREIGISPRRLIDRFLPMTGGASGLLPTLRAFGGLMLADTHAGPAPQTLGRLGSLEVRLARKAAEVRRAQKLRYRVFYKEGNAIPDPAQILAQRDVDAFDGICDHLLVVDNAPAEGGLPRAPSVVGTYRLLRQEIAEQHAGFYTAGEFDIGGLIGRHPRLRFLELGRSCVLPPYRNKRTVELLWQGIYAYLQHHQLDVMIGCASLDGVDPDRLALPLSFLHHYAPAPEAWRARALPQLHVDMNRMPKDAIDPKAALRVLPPLVKGYLRLGAYIGDGAVIDHQFGTTDVLIVLPLSAVKARYIQYFGQSASSAAA
ncbi:MAG: L-ornithine Nalpha-acyltransferase [Alphaproteobacteria bacterium]|jgi:putative hemolysin|nr:L-ornithine Nalpha-acyltransferase [Alphaproteobacteria bacterium]